MGFGSISVQGILEYVEKRHPAGELRRLEMARAMTRTPSHHEATTVSFATPGLKFQFPSPCHFPPRKPAAPCGVAHNWCCLRMQGRISWGGYSVTSVPRAQPRRPGIRAYIWMFMVGRSGSTKEPRRRMSTRGQREASV